MLFGFLVRIIILSALPMPSPGQEHVAALEKLVDTRKSKAAGHITSDNPKPLSSQATGIPESNSKRRQAQSKQPETSNKTARSGDPVDALGEHQQNFKNTMRSYQNIMSRRVTAGLGQVVPHRSTTQIAYIAVRWADR
jgi:hypothetical protein